MFDKKKIVQLLICKKRGICFKLKNFILYTLKLISIRFVLYSIFICQKKIFNWISSMLNNTSYFQLILFVSSLFTLSSPLYDH